MAVLQTGVVPLQSAFAVHRTQVAVVVLADRRGACARHRIERRALPTRPGGLAGGRGAAALAVAAAAPAGEKHGIADGRGAGAVAAGEHRRNCAWRRCTREWPRRRWCCRRRPRRWRWRRCRPGSRRRNGWCYRPSTRRRPRSADRPASSRGTPHPSSSRGRYGWPARRSASSPNSSWRSDRRRRRGD